MKYDLVVVSHNALEYLKNFVASLDKISPATVVLVDTASTDGTREWLNSGNYTPQVSKVITLDENIGYGKALNLGAKECKSAVLGFLNGDTAFVEDITPMLEYLMREVLTGAIAPKQVDSGGSIRHAGIVFGPPQGMKTLVGSYHRGWQQKDVGQFEDIIDAHYLSGYAFLVPATLCRARRGFDERLPLYFDDNLMCLRLQKRGYKTVYYR